MKRLLALVLLAACGPAGMDDSDAARDDLAASGAPLASYDPLASYAAAHKAAAALVANAVAIELSGDRTPQPDPHHADPQPVKPLYKWTWTFRGPSGTVSVSVAPTGKAKARALPQDPTGGLPPLDLSRVRYHPRALYGEMVAAFPAETHHAFDQLVLVGPVSGQPQGWQATVYEQGDDDVMYFVNAEKGGASPMSID